VVLGVGLVRVVGVFAVSAAAHTSHHEEHHHWADEEQPEEATRCNGTP
jgi:hypothetical protein